MILNPLHIKNRAAQGEARDNGPNNFQSPFGSFGVVI